MISKINIQYLNFSKKIKDDFNFDALGSFGFTWLLTLGLIQWFLALVFTCYLGL